MCVCVVCVCVYTMLCWPCLVIRVVLNLEKNYEPFTHVNVLGLFKQEKNIILNLVSLAPI